MLEDHKSAVPLSWAWFGAVRSDRRPSRHLEQAKCLVHHVHQRRRPLSYYTNYELDDDDDDSDNEIKDERNSQPGTPNTPGGMYYHFLFYLFSNLFQELKKILFCCA